MTSYEHHDCEGPGCSCKGRGRQSLLFVRDLLGLISFAHTFRNRCQPEILLLTHEGASALADHFGLWPLDETRRLRERGILPQ